MHYVVAWKNSISVTSRERESGKRWGGVKAERKMDIFNKVNGFRKYRSGSFALDQKHLVAFIVRQCAPAVVLGFCGQND